MKVLDWYKGNKKMRIEEVEIVISKIVEMSYINGSREIRKELEAYVRTSEGFLFFFLSWMIVTSFYMLQGMSQKIGKS